ncbi:MAG: poly-gamma-glutamate synthase PgsB [Candidatus Saccharicenans sp.]
MTIWLLTLLFLAPVFYLYFECRAHRLALGKIPHRVAVTGIRGKSSITRLIAAGLTEAGFRVMAKTTGSKPVLIYPDGREVEIKRRGRPSVLEQKKLVRLAARENVDFLVAEMMSIQPEYLKAESQKLLKPEVIVLSNIRVDHTEFLGKTRQEVAVSLSACFRTGLKVFIPEEEILPELAAAAGKARTEIKPVGRAELMPEVINQLPYAEFEPNLRLAVAVLESYGVSPERIKRGMKKVSPDFGHLRAWQLLTEETDRPVYFVNLFAANDPLSTEEALKLVNRKIDFSRFKVAWLLSFRSDRADRTAQWVEYLEKLGQKPDRPFLKFDVLCLTGPGSSAFIRYLSRHSDWAPGHIRKLKFAQPEMCLKEITSYLLKISDSGKQQTPVVASDLANRSQIISESGSREEDNKNATSGCGLVIIGLGNIIGFGQKMIDYLEREAHAFKL